MTSTNHFRNRELSTNLRSPVSPRRKTRRTAAVSGPVTVVFAIGNVQRLSGIGCADFHDDSMIQASVIDPTHWLVDLGSFSGHAMQLIVTVDVVTLTLSAQYQLDCGSGFLDMARATDPSWAGQSSYDTGPMNWTPDGAIVAGYCRIVLSA